MTTTAQVLDAEADYLQATPGLTSATAAVLWSPGPYRFEERLKALVTLAEVVNAGPLDWEAAGRTESEAVWALRVAARHADTRDQQQRRPGA